MKSPFDIIKSFYNNDWDKITERDKFQNFFMINRIFSILYPLEANFFNHIKIKSERAVDFWKFFITKKHKNFPSFIWTKTIKKEKIKNEYKKEILDFIKEKYQISNREIEELIDFYPDEFKKFYKKIENLLIG